MEDKKESAQELVERIREDLRTGMPVHNDEISALCDALEDMTDDRDSWEKQHEDRCELILSTIKELETAKHDRDVWQKLHMDRCNELLAAGSSLDEANKAMHTESTRQMQNWLHNKRT